MDLQTERRLEQFLRLSDLHCTRIEARLEFIQSPMRFFIEYLEGRILLSFVRPVEASRRMDTLKALLLRCQPARTQGVVLRACVTRDHLMLSCALAPDSDVNHWMLCQRTMRRLLDTHAGDLR